MKHSDGTFMKHLNALRAQGTFTTDFFEMYEELNRTRDHFLHWMPGRFSLPNYRGLDVTTEEGCIAALHAVDDAIQVISGGETMIAAIYARKSTNQHPTGESHDEHQVWTCRSRETARW
jgi:hypothetical protein